MALLELILIGILSGIVSFIFGFFGVFVGLRLLRPLLPGMIWAAISSKDQKGKSMLDLVWNSFQGRINGLAGGRPKKGSSGGAPEISAKMGKMMEWLQLLQTIQAMNLKKPGVTPVTPPQKD